MYKFEARYINMETGDEMYLPIEIDLTPCGLIYEAEEGVKNV